MRIVKLTKETTENILENMLKRSPTQYGTYEASVQEIIENVKTRKDAAVFEYTEKFDHAVLDASTVEVTQEEIDEAYNIVIEVAARGKNVLFVGTKKQAAEVIAEEAQRAGAYYINRRWLGGMLTKFDTIRGRVSKIRELEDFLKRGHAEKLTK